MQIIDARKCLNRGKLEDFMNAMNGVDESLEFTFNEDTSIKFPGKVSSLHTIFKDPLVHETIEVFGPKTEISADSW